MAGKKDLFLLELEALLLEEIRKKPDKTLFLRGYVEKRDDTYHVRPAEGQASHMLKSFALSNCLILVPREVNHLPLQSIVKVHLLPEAIL